MAVVTRIYPQFGTDEVLIDTRDQDDGGEWGIVYPERVCLSCHGGSDVHHRFKTVRRLFRRPMAVWVGDFCDRCWSTSGAAISLACAPPSNLSISPEDA